MLNYTVIQITDENISLLENLALEALEEDHRFVKRTIDEWKENNFSKPGEKFWGIFVEGECIAVGGLNIDPYTEDKNIGRVRHIYVSRKYRRHGLARLLIQMIIDEAKKSFTVLRLSTSNPIAAIAYQSMGFSTSDQYKASHILPLR